MEIGVKDNTNRPYHYNDPIAVQKPIRLLEQYVLPHFSEQRS